jgi:hypothetical protein
MMKRSLVAAILSAFALAAPALALNNRSAVSVNGLDTNPCTPASPCRSFAAAIAQTNAGGEIIALDSAGYGPFTITSSLTVSGAPGVHAAITVTSGGGITVSASSSDNVTIRDLVLIGAGGSVGVSGVTAAELRVLGCTISGFTGNAIACSSARLTVDRCDMLDNGTGVGLTGGNPAAQALIANSLIEHHQVGVLLFASAAAATATIVNTRIFAATNVGISAIALAGQTATAVLDSSAFSQGNVAVSATTVGGASTASVYLANNEIAFFVTGVELAGTASVKSYGDNRFSEVTVVGPLSPASLQ